MTRPGLGAALLIYRALLVVYPRVAREVERDDLLAFFADRYRDAWDQGGWTAALSASLSGFADLIRCGVLERLGKREGERSLQSTAVGETMSESWRDVRIAARSLVRAPGFALAAILTLALGIGANTAIFSVLHAVTLRPLPYPDAERLVVIRRELVVRGIPSYPAAPADLVEYRAAGSFAAIGGLVQTQPILVHDGASERLRGVAATPNILEILGARPALGRLLTVEEGRPSASAEQVDEPRPMPIVLGHGFWIRRFAGDPEILGRTIQLGGPATVVGVLPEDFRLFLATDHNLPEQPDLWMPFVIDEAAPPRVSFFLTTIGRLRPGVTHEAARAELDAIGERQRERYANAAAAGTHPRLIGMHSDLTGSTRRLLGSLMGAVAFVLLIACVNVSNLLLVRAAARKQEMSIRAALGGGRRRLVRQMMAEALVLATAGGALGVVFAAAGMQALKSLIPTGFPRVSEIGLDGGVLLFTASATMATALLFGVIPALYTSRSDLMSSLRERKSAGAPNRVRGGLVIAEVALSFVLVVGAGLMVRSFVALQDVDPGFRADGVLSFRASLAPGTYPEREARTDVKRTLGAQLASIPGVMRVGATGGLPLGDGGSSQAPYGNEAALADGDESDLRQAFIRNVWPGYFETLATPVLEGRVFDDTDLAEDSVRHVVVDRTLAEKAWPGESAIGKRLYVKTAIPGIWVEVIGVVGHQRHAGLTGASQDVIYFSDHARGSSPSVVWVLRTEGDPLSLVPAARAAVAQVDDRILIENVQPLTELVTRAESPTRTILVLAGAFGVLALVLAAIGLYGVIAYVVRERTREIGIRVALGAKAPEIARMALGRAVRLVAVGTALGIMGALASTRVMTSVLIGVEPNDPLTIVAAVSLFGLVAVIACLAPTGRALRVDPVTALRQE